MVGRSLVQHVLIVVSSALLLSCGGEEKLTYLDLEEDPEDFPVMGSTPYAPITGQYSHINVNAQNAQYLDSDRFRIYYGGNGLYGGNSNLSEETEQDVRLGLAQLENAYEYFVHNLGFRSPSLSVNNNDGPFYKFNIYVTNDDSSFGHMNYNKRVGLGYIEVRQGTLEYPRLVQERGILVHEFGHAITYSEHRWIDQSGADCWWEGVADWAEATYATSSAYQQMALEYGLDPYDNLPGFHTTVASAHLSIAHEDNCYDMWPFLVYLTRNPDGLPGLGSQAVLDLIRNHRRNNETPLHVLERLVAPATVQQVLGQYWARMAYADIDYPHAQESFLISSRDPTYSEFSFDNWDHLGNGHFRVKEEKKPMYGGANIVPLLPTSDTISVSLNNLGNGLEDSNFTATISIRDVATGLTRYVDLPEGIGSVTLSENEVAAIVVVNTPDALYQYSAYNSFTGSREQIGLNYEVYLEGALTRETVGAVSSPPGDAHK